MQRDSVEAALARIEESKPFALSLRMRRFLRFAVERALADDRDALKEYTIGVEVFGRSADYDTRMHHTNMDFYERVKPDDLKQSAVVLATFTYQAAMRAARFPRGGAIP